MQLNKGGEGSRKSGGGGGGGGEGGIITSIMAYCENRHSAAGVIAMAT